MSEGKLPIEPTSENFRAGFCSATCTDKAAGKAQLKQPDLKTSDLFITCNLPKRFEHPHWFNGYGCQVSNQHPFYRTSASEYGWYPPGYYSVPTVFFPAGQKFTNALSAAGMYRNYSLNTGMDQGGYYDCTRCGSCRDKPKWAECECLIDKASLVCPWCSLLGCILSYSPNLGVSHQEGSCTAALKAS